MLDHKIELLKQVPLFDALGEVQLSIIAAAGEKLFFEAGEHIIAQGEKGGAAYLVMSGKAFCSRYDHGQPFTQDLWPGTLVGELGMLVETVHSVTVTASERLRALAIHRESFRVIMEAHPQIAAAISKKLLERLHNLATELREVDRQLAEAEKAA